MEPMRWLLAVLLIADGVSGAPAALDRQAVVMRFERESAAEIGAFDPRADRRRLQEAPDYSIQETQGYYYHVDDTNTTIISGFVELEDFLYSRDLDLKIVATRVQWGSTTTLIWNPKPAGSDSHRKVHIHAFQLDTNIFLENTFDLRGELGSSFDIAADSGRSPGQAGTNGTHGAAGSNGGVVILEFARITGGGRLTFKVTGGNGGNGQDGGDGAAGREGIPRDPSACCFGMTTIGENGGAGGAAGKGGSAGAGGNGGWVNIFFTEKWDSSLTGKLTLKVQSAPGDPGTAGRAGRAGIGGAPGLGSYKDCKRVGHATYRCSGELEASGQQGSEGSSASGGELADKGISNDQKSRASKMTEIALRAHSCRSATALDMELKQADSKYLEKKLIYNPTNNEGDLFGAKELYEWVVAAESGCTADQKVQLALIDNAKIKLQQLTNLQDFFGRSSQFTPLVTADVLHDKTVSLLELGRSAENEVAKYRTMGSNQQSGFQSSTSQVADYALQINMKDEELNSLVLELNSLREDIRLTRKHEAAASWMESGKMQICDGALEHKVRTEEGQLNSRLDNIYEFYSQVIPVGSRQLTSMLSSGTNYLNWYAGSETYGLNTLARGEAWAPAAIDDYVNIVSSDVPWIMDTGVGQADIITAESQGVINGINTTWQTVDRVATESRASTKAGADVNTQKTLASEDFFTAINAYLYDIPECQAVCKSLERVTALTKKNAQLADAYALAVTQIGVKQTERAQIVENRQLSTHTRSGSVDPYLFDLYRETLQTYTTIKTNIVDALGQMRYAVDFENCEEPLGWELSASTIDHLTIQENIVFWKMQDKRKEYSSRRTTYGHVDSSTGKITANTIITFSTADNSLTYDGSSGTLKFDLAKNNAALPQHLSNLRIVSVNGWAPAISDATEVWIKKGTDSTCVDHLGQVQTFSHKSRSYYSKYSLINGKPDWETHSAQTSNFVEPAPIGSWEMSVPGVDSSTVTEFELHLILSGVPFQQSGTSASASTAQVRLAKAGPAGSTSSKVESRIASSQSWHWRKATLLLTGVAAVVSALVVFVFLLHHRQVQPDEGDLNLQVEPGAAVCGAPPGRSPFLDQEGCL